MQNLRLGGQVEDGKSEQTLPNRIWAEALTLARRFGLYSRVVTWKLRLLESLHGCTI
jgi:hypothetical protein